MREALLRLEGCPGVRGALVMALDGMLVAHVGDEGASERIAAFVSAMLLSMEKDAEALGFVPLRGMTLWAARGRLMLRPMGDLVLIVLADLETDLGHASVEIEGLAQGLLRRSRIDVEV